MFIPLTDICHLYTTASVRHLTFTTVFSVYTFINFTFHLVNSCDCQLLSQPNMNEWMTLSALTSQNRHLYADTQHFFSFHPRNFDSSIAHLQTALQQISSWMPANLLTLNSSKTEFPLIGLIKQQRSKTDNSSLNTTHSASNLGFIFDEHLTFSDQISSLSKSRYSHPWTSLHPSFSYLDSKTGSRLYHRPFIVPL